VANGGRAPRRAPGARGVRAFLRTRRSAVAVELAIVMLPFIVMLLGVFEVTYDLYAQIAVNYILGEVARGVWTGKIQTQGSGAQSSAAFVSANVCPLASGLLDCSYLFVQSSKLTTVTQGSTNFTATADFFHINTWQYDNAGALNVNNMTVCTGGPNNLVMLEMIYAGPTFLGALFPKFSLTSSLVGAPRVHPTYASIGFGNQAFTATGSC